jgi:branched-chain amino acid transport system permease protein
VRKGKGNLIGFAILFGGLAAMPAALGEYQLNILLMIVIWIIVAVSYRLLATTGEFSLGHVVVMGIGAYGSAMISRYIGLPVWVCMPLGGLVAAGFAALTAYPMFRMKGFYFLLGSFALGEAVRLSWNRWKFPFGGPSGLWNIAPPSAGGFIFDTTISYFYLTVGVAAVCVFVMLLIDQSRVGQNFKAIHWQDRLAESLGISVFRHKMTAYITASFFAGVAGALLAHFMGAISPGQFSLHYMLYVLVWVIVGGTNTYWGAIIGVLTLYSMQEGMRYYNVPSEYIPMIYGIILIGILFALPDGLESLPSRIREFRRSRRGK